MTRQESLQRELTKIVHKQDASLLGDMYWQEDALIRLFAVTNYSLNETQLDIAELLILRYYECGGE